MALRRNHTQVVLARRTIRKALKHRKPTFEIPNYKHQITNKSQIPIINHQNMFGISNFGHCDFFDICYLEFRITP
jgi:hypothetical protein